MHQKEIKKIYENIKPRTKEKEYSIINFNTKCVNEEKRSMYCDGKTCAENLDEQLD